MKVNTSNSLTLSHSISYVAFLVVGGNKGKQQNCESYSVMLYMFLMICKSRAIDYWTF